ATANNLVIAVFAMELAAVPPTVLLFLEADLDRRDVVRRTAILIAVAFGLLVAGTVLVGVSRGTIALSRGEMPLAASVAAGSHKVLTPVSTLGGDVGCLLVLAGLGVHFFAAPFQLAAGELFEDAKLWTAGTIAV